MHDRYQLLGLGGGIPLFPIAGLPSLEERKMTLPAGRLDGKTQNRKPKRRKYVGIGAAVSRLTGGRLVGWKKMINTGVAWDGAM